MVRGERPIKLRYSWFFAKSILVERLKFLFRGKALNKQKLKSFGYFNKT